MEDISKLPKWAQEKIKTLERERENAIRQLNDYLDSQTKSPFYITDLVSTGEAERGPSYKTTYIQTNKMTIFHAGVLLDILLREGQIDLSWGGDHSRLHEIAFIPSSHQSARLVSKENMR